MTVINQNLIQEEFKRRLDSGNACCHSVQDFLSYCLLSKNVKTIIYKAIILPLVLCGYYTWSLTLREKHRDWRNLHYDELCDLYSLPSRIRSCRLDSEQCRRVFRSSPITVICYLDTGK
jgi:hypothetical protein